jgi:uncharacterized protein YqhQ
MSDEQGDGPLTAAPIGGQAVLEGVMMRGVGTWAVAVRAPADAGAPSDVIEVRSFPIEAHRRRVLRHVPVVRGVVALWDSQSIGLRALQIAAVAQLPREDGKPPEVPRGAWVAMMAVSVAFAVGLFFVVPVGATSLLRHRLGSAWLFWLVEGGLRTVIFLGYLTLLARMRELRRLLEYHGAEHKVISCHEAGDELTPERAARYPRLHPRCGTSFLLIVMLISIFVFAPLGLPAWWVLVLTRILGVPVIAGLAFEVIRWAARHRGRGWVELVMWPGLQLQRLTTREPDSEQLAVAIASLRAVLASERPGERTAVEMLGLEVIA